MTHLSLKHLDAESNAEVLLREQYLGCKPVRHL